MVRNLFFLLLVLGTSTFLKSQEVLFKATVEKTEVSVNERFVVQFVLTHNQENLKIDRSLRLPDFGELQQLGVSPFNRFQFANGASIYQMGVESILVADHEGTYQVGSATITIGGKQYKTEPFKITVKKGLKPKEPAGQRTEDAFIAAEVSNDNPFLNQEVILVVKMYSRDYAYLQRIRNFKEPDFTDVIAKYVSENTDEDEKQVLVNGKTYISKVLSRYVIFPQKSGEIEIDPFSLNVLLSSFFGTESIPMSSDPIVLKVKNLPSKEKPSNFSGAVGDFTMNTTLSKSTVKTNETVNLEVEIVGSGNLNTLKTPEFKAPEYIESYAPKKRDAFEVRPSGMKGKVAESVLLVPQYGGEYTIGPIVFNYFDPDRQKYVSLKSESYLLKVNGPKPPVNDTLADVSPTEKDEEKGSALEKYIPDLPVTFDKVKERVTESVERKNTWTWGVGGFALLVALILLYKKRNRNHTGPKTKKQLHAEFKTEINNRLDELKKMSTENKTAEFLSLQEEILTQIGMYYSQTNLSDFTENEVADKLTERFGELSIQWKQLLLSCKQSRYGMGGAEELKSKLIETEKLWSAFQKI